MVLHVSKGVFRTRGRSVAELGTDGDCCTHLNQDMPTVRLLLSVGQPTTVLVLLSMCSTPPSRRELSKAR